MEFVNRIINLITNNNCMYVKHLGEIIIFNKFKSIDELKAYEDELFTVDDKLLNEDERIEYAIKLLEPGFMDYEKLTYEEIGLYDEYISKIKDTTLSNEERIFNLIKIFELTKRNMYFVCETYQYILDGKFDK